MQPGYSLMELIAVMGILLTVTLFAFQHSYLETLQTEGIIRGFTSDLRYIYHKNSYGDLQTRLHYLYEEGQSAYSGSPVGYYLVEEGKKTREIYFPQGTVFESKNKLDPIQFKPSGTLYKAGETFRFSDSQSGNNYRITIVPFSGRVEVYKNE